LSFIASRLFIKPITSDRSVASSRSSVPYAYLLVLIPFLLLSALTHAAEKRYSVAFEAPSSIEPFLRRHLEISQSLDNPRLNDTEWYRLIRASPKEIEALLATEGYFSAKVEYTTESSRDQSRVKFTIETGTQAIVSDVDIRFIGDIIEQPEDSKPSIQHLTSDWGLVKDQPFNQERWDQEKRKLLSSMVVFRYPNARIQQSRAEVDTKENRVKLTVIMDSGKARTFGELNVTGLQRYPERIIGNINPIKPDQVYDQASLLRLQSEIQATGYFSSVEVTADPDTDADQPIPVQVKVLENQAIKVGVGVGASTNTGARTQLTYDDLNLLGRGWRLNSSLRLEQRAQSLNARVTLPTDEKGYRDSFSNNTGRQDIEGQVLTTTNSGIKRTWGPYRFEQSIGANYLIEHAKVDGADSTTKDAATLSYGLTLRRTDHDLLPTRGYLFTTQFTVAPWDALSDGTFLRSYAKTQAYFPLSQSTQLMTRLEVGAVTGANSAPETYLFRAGGDQSVRGYGFQSLGIQEADATVGARYLLTGSVELVQWLTHQWGAAFFVDFGNAANEIDALEPVYGYGLGIRWKSPAGPLGADIAYGEDTGEYRLHFNLGVNF
jgi:translocation and assembly module TamA